MRGGGREYVMGVYNNTIGESQFASLPDAKYFDNYTSYASNYKGDAIYETSSSGNNYSNDSWEYARFNVYRLF